VIRIGRSLKVFQVTGDTGSRGQVVISVGVALRALHLRVRTSQRKRCLGVIETGRLPGRSRMANFALLRHASRDVIRICSSLEVLNVTGDAGGRRQVVIAVGVALVALKLCMSTRKRKPNRIMIEARRLPRCSRVTILASLGQAERNVIGVARFLKIWQVAAHARSGRPRIFSSGMARCTVQGRVHASECKTRKLQVVKFRVLPVVNRMTLLALRWKPGSDVVGRGSLLEGSLVAGVTLDRKTLKLPDRFALVTVRAVESRMAAYKRKAVIVFLYPLSNDVPSLHGMTLLTIGTHLASMNVGMTVSTVRSSVGEYWLGMALSTGNTLVQAA